MAVLTDPGFAIPMALPSVQTTSAPMKLLPSVVQVASGTPAVSAPAPQAVTPKESWTTSGG